MKQFDAVVVGGGLLGCFAARELMRHDLTALLLEQREDVCTGISKANTAIIYPGYDHKPGTLKQAMTVRANLGFDQLCSELEVPFRRCGSLMISCGEKSDKVLQKKYEVGTACGVPGLRMVSSEEAAEILPGLGSGVTCGIYAPSAGITDPWQLCYAAYENALANGCAVSLNTKLLAIRRDQGGYLLETTQGEFSARAIINCAGLFADKVHEMLFPPSVRIFPQGADYLLLERESAELPVIFQQETEDGKGLTAVPTIGGTVMLGPTERDCEEELSAVSASGMEEIITRQQCILPGLNSGSVIRSFAAVRPLIRSVSWNGDAFVPDGKSIGSFAIEHPEPGFLSLIGIKTPGLTCSRELGSMAAESIAEYLNAKKRTDFCPNRKAIPSFRTLKMEERQSLIAEDPAWGRILCRCEDISEAQVLEAIARGAVTLDGIKRRCGAGLGICQGSFCQGKSAELLAKSLGISMEEVTLHGGDSRLGGGE